MSKRIFSVTVPIAGHACIEVEAENEKDAIAKALDEVTMSDIEEWEAVEAFNRGNVCYCPSPWEVEVEDQGPADDEEDTAASGDRSEPIQPLPKP